MPFDPMSCDRHEYVPIQISFRMKGAVVCCVVFLAVLTAGTQKLYKSHRVVRVVPATESQAAVLNALREQHRADKVDFWTPVRAVGKPVDIHLSPDIFDSVYGALVMFGMKPNVIIDDMQTLIDRQRSPPRVNVTAYDYTKYHAYDEIQGWIDEIAANELATPFNVGTSFEGRDTRGIQIKTSDGNKPMFFMEGGIHAREWISPATVAYMTNQLLERYAANPDGNKWIDYFDWYIVPVVNPDGYSYTWTNDRMWRKTRSGKNETGICVGADPNRNWDSHWCEEGASSIRCTDTYCGDSVFSEVEVKSIADFIDKTVKSDKAAESVFIDFHSYSQLWMTPWGWTTDLPPEYNEQMKKGGEDAITALEAVHGTKYEVGSIANIIYKASGSSADWAYDKHKIIYSYGVELRDEGRYGFLLPDDQIIPSGEETFAAIEALAKFICQC